MFPSYLKKITRAEVQESQDTEPYRNQPLHKDLSQNVQMIQTEMGNSKDVSIQRLLIAGTIAAAAVYTEGLSDQKLITELLSRSIPPIEASKDGQATCTDTAFQQIKEQFSSFGKMTEITDWGALFLSLLSGNSILLLDGCDKALAASTKGGETRGVTEPTTQTVIRGPREAFSESIRTNSALIRRKIKSPKLWLEEQIIGELTQTSVGIMYIKGIAQENMVQEVRDRLNRIKIDGILESGYIEDLIQDEIWTPFPTMYNSERPDVIAAGLLEGRVAILVDGTPFVLLVPIVFMSFLQSAEDYYQRYDLGSFLRILRFVSFFIALLLPGLYVAISTFHQELLPTPLMLHLAFQREGVPFPPLFEAFMMEIVFEVLREAGVRMPSAVGNTISIVGALVIGQAAVEAGIVTPAMVIVVSFTAIANFVIPAINFAISVRLLRFLFLILCGSMGLFGMAIGLLLMILHLSSIRSFGIPYLKPFAPLFLAEHQDTLLRFPLWARDKRPHFLAKNVVRQAPDQKPQKPPGDSPRSGGD